MFFSASGFCQTKAYYEDIDNDGKNDNLVMENQYFRIKFNPSAGGKGIELFYKPENKRMDVGRNLFMDHVVELGEMFDQKLYNCDHPYQSEIIKTGPDTAIIKLYANLIGAGSFEAYKDVVIERTYTLRQDSPVIEVQIEVKNNSKEKLPFTYMVSHHTWVVDEDCWHFVPDELGVLNELDSIVRSFSAPVGSQEPTASFSGFVSVQSRLGLVFIMDWKYLDAIENWLSKGPGAVVQWPYRKQILEPGTSWKTSYIVYPVKNLDSLDYATEKIAIGITAGEKSDIGNFVSRDELKVSSSLPIKVSISSPTGGRIKTEYGYRIFPEEKETILGTGDLKLKKVEASKFQFPLSIERKDSTYVVFVKALDEKNQLLAKAELPLKIGSSPYTYFMKKKEGQQVGEKFYGYQIITPPLPDWYAKVDLSIETPHIKWAKPWVNGKTNVLFVNRSDNSVGYWREIWQRCDIDFDVSVLAWDATKKFPYAQNTLKDLLKKLSEKDYDLLFFSALHWNQGFPAYIQESIYSFIKKGKGAVILGNLANKDLYGDLEKFLRENGKEVDASWLTKGIPYRMPRVWVFEVGRGRVVVIDGNPASGYESVAPSLGDWQAEGRWMWIPGWEYSFGMFSRAILWAGNKDSGINIVDIKEDKGVIKVEIENTKGELNCLYDIRIHNAFFEIEQQQKNRIKLSPGRNNLELKITKPLSDKVHLANLKIEDEKGRSIGWATCKFNVVKDVEAKVSFDRDTCTYRENEDINVIVSIDNKSQSRKLKLRFNVEDASKRIIQQEEKDIELQPGKNQFTFKVDKSRMLQIYHEAEISIFDGQNIVSKDRNIFFVYPEKMPLYDDFYLACWGDLDTNPLKVIISGQKLKEAGIDYVYSYGSGKTARYVAYRTGHLLMGPPFSCSLKNGYTGRRKADSKTLTYDPPLVPSDEEIQKFRESMKNTAKSYGEIGGADYIHLDDERDMQAEFDWSERTIAKFREWLKEQYGTLEALNRQWDTNYRDWQEIMPVRSTEIKDLNNISQWLDWRLFTGWAIHEYYYKLPAEAAKEGNPGVVVGQHGMYTPSPTIPHDYWQIAKYTPVTGRYNGMEEEWCSSFGVISGQYGGYGIEEATPRHRYHPWRSLLHGGHWAFYYIIWNSGSYHQGILSPDQSVHGGYNDLAKDEFSDLKKGIGKLFIKTKFSHDGIAFPYSQSTIIASSVLGLSRTGNMYSQKTLVENIGYQHRFLSYEQIENGELIKQGFKVLILPTTACLSTKEIENIKQFVRNGGLLVADYEAGTRDQHGKVYPVKSGLDEVFGIDRTAASIDRYMTKLTFLKDSWFGEKQMELKRALKGLKLTTGKNMAVFEDGTPAMILNQYGSGMAIYLNIDLSDYAGMKPRGVAGEVILEEKGKQEYVSGLQEIFEKIINKAGIKKRLEILVDNKPVNAGERFYYTDGISTYCAYMPEAGKQQEVKITLGKKSHVYDVRNRKYIGFSDSFNDIIKPGNVKIYSLMPYKVEDIDVAVKNSYRQGENIDLKLAIKTNSGTPGTHILRIELYKDGKILDAYSRNIVAEKGQANCRIPLAFNEGKGRYNLVIRDINSGLDRTKSFRII